MSILYTVADVETTGLEPGSRIVELAFIAINADGETVNSFRTMVNPGMPLPPDVQAVHGLTDSDLIGAPDAAEALNNLVDWMDEVRAREVSMIAHNAPFDVQILSWEAQRTGVLLPISGVIDTCAMAKVIGATKKNSLEVLVQRYGIQPAGPAHRAFTDADACRQYWNIARTLTSKTVNIFAAPFTYTDQLPPALERLPELIANGEHFAFGYTDDKGARTDRSITPYGFAKKGDELYFHGLCHLRGERRTFRADRIAA